MDPAEYTIVILNLFLGFGGAWLLLPLYSRLTGRTGRKYLSFSLIVGVYLFECVAFSAGMATNVFSIGLAFLWGALIGSRLRRSPAGDRAPSRSIVLFSLYTSLPAVSLLSIPVVGAIGGTPVLSAAEGARFGIPEFVPWPFNNILGFCLAVAVMAVVSKVAVTSGLAMMLLRKRSSGDPIS